MTTADPKNILLAGASGSLGLEILKILSQESYHVRALILSEDDNTRLHPYTQDIWKLDAGNQSFGLKDIAEGIDVVVSAMGKSVSLFTDRGNSFYKDDFEANNNLLTAAKNANVRRFVYVSIKGASLEEEFEITKGHKKFEEALEVSGLDYSILRPVGFFSGLHDLAIMAKRKVIPVIGDGSARTNSIHQKDLAKLVVETMLEGPEVKEVGGPKIHTRLEMAEMISEKVGGKIIKVPEKVAEWGVVLPEFFDQSTAEKLKYFKYITTHDMIGEKYGTQTFAKYLEDLDLNTLP